MNQEYIILGGIFWRLLGRKIFFWRNHPQGNLLTKLAIWLSDTVFCTSDKAFVTQSSKTILMPVGIDTDLHKSTSVSNSPLKSKNILFLSRMSQIKRPDLLIEALKILKEKNIDFSCHFYGEALPRDQIYFDKLRLKVQEFGLLNQVDFWASVPNSQTTSIYNKHRIFVNLTPSGSMDKTILEAGASGCIPVVINDYFRGIFESEMITTGDARDLAAKLNYWLAKDELTVSLSSKKIEQYVKENHSLDFLVEKLYAEILR